MNLAECILTGCENGTSNKSLALLLGCSKREARKIINQACCSGMPICSDERGYYFPATLEEAKRCERIRLARAATSRRATAGLRAYINAAEAAASGQLSVFDYLEKEKSAIGAANTDDGNESD